MDNLRFSSAPTADSIDASIAQHYPACEPVAVIGYACHFPESPDGEPFWQNLLEGRECSRRFTREELLAVGLDAAIIDDPHYVNIGTVLDNADCFDATLFGYSRQEAESMIKTILPPAPRTNSTCTARRYRYRPPAPARWLPCIWPVKACALANPIWRLPAAWRSLSPSRQATATSPE